MYLRRYPRSSRWYVCWRDRRGRERRWAAFPSKTLSFQWGTKLDQVVEHRAAGARLTPELKDWVRSLPPPRIRELVKLGIVASADVVSKGIGEMLTEYGHHLKALNRGATYARHTPKQAETCLVALGVVRIADLHESSVIALMREFRATRSAATVNHYLVALKGFVAWCIRRGYADANPIVHVRRLNVAVEGLARTRRAMSEKESSALLASLKESAPDRYWLYRFALETGLRRGEIKGLKVASVDLKSGWVHVPAAYSRKGGRLRSVPLSGKLCRDLKAAWRGRGASERAFKVPPRTAAVLANDLKAAGVVSNQNGKVIDFHSLRHTYATRAGAETETFADLMELLGHRSPAMTARYAHAERDRLKKVADRLAQ